MIINKAKNNKGYVFLDVLLSMSLGFMVLISILYLAGDTSFVFRRSIDISSESNAMTTLNLALLQDIEKSQNNYNYINESTIIFGRTKYEIKNDGIYRLNNGVSRLIMKGRFKFEENTINDVLYIKVVMEDSFKGKIEKIYRVRFSSI